MPTTTDYITVAIPNGTGYTYRTRTAAVASGTSQFTLADAAGYWGRGSTNAALRNAYLYAIWAADAGASSPGLVWALGGFSGMLEVTTTTTATETDYLLIEDGNTTYSRAATDYCVCVGKIRYEYDTGDTPDHTIQTAGEDAPIIVYNPKSDFFRSSTNATTDTASGADTAEVATVAFTVPQTGVYFISGHVSGLCTAVNGKLEGMVKTGSGTYSSASYRAYSGQAILAGYYSTAAMTTTTRLSAGDTIHLGVKITRASASGDTLIGGDDAATGYTQLTAVRID